MATDATGTPTPLGIPTYNINVDAPSGNGFNAAMAAIDTLVGGRAPLASPALTGTPTAPTPATADNSTRIATTAFVDNYVASLGYLTTSSAAATYLTIANAASTYLTIANAASTYAPLASPALTGTPTAPTPATGDSSTKISTTAFVKAQGYAALAGAAFTGDVSTTGALLSSSPTKGVGYAAGAGGTYTQLTSKTTSVAVTTLTGQITTSNTSLPSGIGNGAAFLVTDANIAATDVVVVNVQNDPVNYSYIAWVDSVSAGQFRVVVANVGGATRSDALVLNYAVIKAVAA